MFERFSPEGRQVMVLADQQARELGHDYVGTEHILLGLLRQSSIASEVLAGLGVSFPAAREEVAALVGQRPDAQTDALAFTPRAKKALQFAMQASRRLNYEAICPEHLLIGIAEEGEGVAMATLLRFRIEEDQILDKLKERVEKDGRTWKPSAHRRPAWKSQRLLPWRAAELIESHERGLLEERVRRELELLSRYAKSHHTTLRDPSRATGRERAYISGALTTLRHLGLLTDDEYQAWQHQLLGDPPPGGQAGSFFHQD